MERVHHRQGDSVTVKKKKKDHRTKFNNSPRSGIIREDSPQTGWLSHRHTALPIYIASTNCILERCKKEPLLSQLEWAATHLTVNTGKPGHTTTL